jgi:ketopantoate hydroxymethyltransferase
VIGIGASAECDGQVQEVRSRSFPTADQTYRPKG